ncbi:SDR family NAD(P)-dependent oxidoreductase [Phenylobacterium sp.]|uniref:SDR family NAD(P)-dependent oxidoreductase n=1 Tax=Phenylobacterium sp. TaxID=1871053 RepID=UPI0025D194CF|nr:SDR family NAD(P)-dependent oxidoreductase [Phenylobacterium sp.]
MSEMWAQGRIALVTGATSGFGEAMARRLVAAGARVIATGRRAERLADLAKDLATDRLLTRELDVTDPASIAALLPGLPGEFEAIDILYNNAGLALGLSKAHEADLADWETMIATNVTGLVRMTRAVLPGMVARNRGDVINLSSVAASYPYPGGNVYGATKSFVRQFSLNLRSDLLGTKVRVTSIEPGMADTEFSVVRFKGDQAAADNVYKGVHAMSADDVALVCESVLKLPAHINVNTLELMPVQQAWGPFAVDRG